MYHSPTFGPLNLEQMLSKIIAYTANEEFTYKLIIGSDSNPEKNGLVELITAIVIQRKGNGGIYFWHKQKVLNIYGLRSRIYQEAMASINCAREIVEKGDIPLLLNDIEIHVDVGTNGETREMIKEVVGMVRGNGFPVKTKPEAYAASKVADRHT